jgi:hypothetical protein
MKKITNQELIELNSALTALGAHGADNAPQYRFSGIVTLRLAQLRKWANESAAVLTNARNDLIKNITNGKLSMDQLPEESRPEAENRFHGEWRSMLSTQVDVPFSFSLKLADLRLDEGDGGNNISVSIVAALLPVLDEEPDDA